MSRWRRCFGPSSSCRAPGPTDFPRPWPPARTPSSSISKTASRRAARPRLDEPVGEWLTSPPTSGSARFVRVNGVRTAWIDDDLKWVASVSDRVDAVVVPKAESEQDVERVAARRAVAPRHSAARNGARHRRVPRRSRCQRGHSRAALRRRRPHGRTRHSAHAGRRGNPARAIAGRAGRRDDWRGCDRRRLRRFQRARPPSPGRRPRPRARLPRQDGDPSRSGRDHQ